jgi:orotate phosphoribosyltransferase
MEAMLTLTEAKAELLNLLQTNSVRHGDFVLSSGARSKYYVDCKLTTLDPRGAWLVGEVMHSIISREAAKYETRVDAVGGLTMGADPIALAVGIYSYFAKDCPPLQTFIVRKTPKSHGQAKLIEGNFKPGDSVVVIDDVVTKGDSTIKAIEAVTQAGGKIAFVAVLVDRQEGGRQKIEAMGYRVVAAFQRDELLSPDAKSHQPTDCVVA